MARNLGEIKITELIRQGQDWQAKVDINSQYQFVMIIDTDYAQTLIDSQLDKKLAERLVIESFKFLLEREPAAAILPEFKLSLIRQYWPDYDQIIKQQL